MLELEKSVTEFNLALSIYQDSLKYHYFKRSNKSKSYPSIASLIDAAKNCFYRQLDELLSVHGISFHLNNGAQFDLAKGTLVSGYPILIFDRITENSKCSSTSVHVYSIAKITLKVAD